MTGTASLSPVVKYHGLARRDLAALGFLMRPLLNGGTLGGLMSGAEFLARHPASEHPYLAVVHAAVAAGSCEPDGTGSTVNCDQLLSTYSQRARHLLQFQTPHAVELRGETEVFCRRLSAALHASAQFWGFALPRGVHYLFVERVDTYELLGTLRTISKLDVTAEEWLQLWGRDA